MAKERRTGQHHGSQQTRLYIQERLEKKGTKPLTLFLRFKYMIGRISGRLGKGEYGIFLSGRTWKLPIWDAGILLEHVVHDVYILVEKTMDR